MSVSRLSCRIHAQRDRKYLHEQTDRPPVLLGRAVVEGHTDRDLIRAADSAEIGGKHCIEQIRA